MFDTGKEEVAYLADIDGKIPSDAVPGDIAVFGSDGDLADSGSKPSDFATTSAMEQAVGDALTEAWDAISGEYAVAAYKASSWEASYSYGEGDFCKYGGEGYVCTQTHTSGSSFSEDSGKWKKVLTAAGVSALDAMLTAVVSDKAWLDDLAPAFSDTQQYSVNQLVKKDGALKICTQAGTGSGAMFSTATVEQSMKARYEALLALIPDNPGESSDWLKQIALDSEYDSTRGYSVGETCTHEGEFWRCTSQVLTSTDWDESKWESIPFRDYVAGGALQVQANWSESSASSAAYIRNKPVVPVVDATLSVQGAAADAKKVGDELATKADVSSVPSIDETLSTQGAAADAYEVGRALAEKVSSGSLPYKIKILGGTTYSDSSDSSSPDDSSSAPIFDPNDPTKVRFVLEDRTINVVDMTMSGNLDTIVLTPPEIQGPNLSRDFYVVFRVTSPVEVSVEMERASLLNYAGSPAEVHVISGSLSTYRFTEMLRLGYVFLVTCLADPAYTMVKEIDRALDDILEGLGETPDFEKGVYIPDENDSTKLYKIVAVNDGGEVNIGIEQNPVEL